MCSLVASCCQALFTGGCRTVVVWELRTPKGWTTDVILFGSFIAAALVVHKQTDPREGECVCCLGNPEVGLPRRDAGSVV